ncbi:head maturation protease, ClpP-related [Cytobacillus sp. IB215316]|uniref:head maturation protease, ClpP-related n=1 Tax=Cytobacillus sp. IB215316 TaxID=3097354 RepID=UPI002A159C33|nr:head maturation protease, ClpP-related [Cytobacillus sp. IB215316]MDX8359819.1 ATP-dependent Clp protease proteolytic subunit [Cytobacillus sp. IB215316]
MKHRIKGDIVRWNSSIWDFDYRMKSIKDDEDIELSINSYGGDAFLGIDMCNTLRDHKGNVTITITGIAASAASVICMGADKVIAHANTMIMVHNASTLAYGNAKELRKAADNLDKVSHSAMQSYLKRVDADKMKELMDEETYLTAQDALDIGLIDEIINAEVEEVESEIFENKAKEFNNKLVTMQEPSVVANNANYEEMFNELKNEIEQLKKQSQKEPEQEPVRNSNLSKLFLNL